MATVEKLLTAEEYRLSSEFDGPTELVRGRVVEMNLPNPRHGEVCLQVGFLLKAYLKDHPIGRAVSNDAGFITERDPDTVRGPDVAFYRSEDVGDGPLPDNYMETPPRLVFEVLSPSDRWNDVRGKVTEFLDAGVEVVCVLDPSTERAHLYFQNQPDEILNSTDEFTISHILPEFRVHVKEFFAV